MFLFNLTLNNLDMKVYFQAGPGAVNLSLILPLRELKVRRNFEFEGSLGKTLLGGRDGRKATRKDSF